MHHSNFQELIQSLEEENIEQFTKAVVTFKQSSQPDQWLDGLLNRLKNACGHIDSTNKLSQMYFDLS
jgi:hypothetical protein